MSTDVNVYVPLNDNLRSSTDAVQALCRHVAAEAHFWPATWRVEGASTRADAWAMQLEGNGLTLRLRPQLASVTLFAGWKSFLREPLRTRAAVREFAFALARRLGAQEARYAADDWFAQDLYLDYIQHRRKNLSDDEALGPARVAGALRNVLRDDAGPWLSVWTDDFSDLACCPDDDEARVRALGVFGRLGIEPCRWRRLAGAPSGRLVIPGRHWVAAPPNRIEEPEGERLLTPLVPVATCSPAVGLETVRALDELATYLAEDIAVFGYDAGLSPDVREPSGQIVGVRVRGFPIIRVTGADPIWDVLADETVHMAEEYELLLDAEDPRAAAALVRTTVQGLRRTGAIGVLPLPEEVVAGQRRISAVHVRSRLGMRTIDRRTALELLR